MEYTLKGPDPTESGTTVVSAFVNIKINPEYTQRLESQMSNSIVHNRGEAGNSGFHFFQQKDKPGAYLLFETWKDQASLDYHMRQSYTTAIFDILVDALAFPIENMPQYTDFVVELFPAPLLEGKQVTTPEEVGFCGKLVTKPGSGPLLEKQIGLSVDRARQETDNIDFQFFKVIGQDNTYYLYEKWKNIDSLHQFGKTDYIQELFGVFAETLTKPLLENLVYLHELFPDAGK